MRTTTGAMCAVLAATTVFGVSACSKIEPKVAFAKAYQTTTSQKDLTQTVTIRTTSADVGKLVTALGGDDVTDPSQKVALSTLKKVLPKLTMTSRIHSTGGNLDSETDQKKLDQAGSIAIDGSGIEFMAIGGQPFVKADVEGLGRKTGLFTAMQAKMLLDSAPKQMVWLNDLVDGRWIGFPASSYDQLLKTKGADLANDPAKAKELREKMQASVERNATFEKVDDSHVNLSIKLKPFLKDVQAATASAMPSASPSPTPFSDKDLKGLKDDAVLKVVTTTENDKLTEAVIDIPQMWGWVDESTMNVKDKAQLAKVKASGFAGAIVMKMSTDPVSLTKPADAKMLTEADIDELEKMGSTTTSTSMSSSSAAVAPAA